METQPKWVLFSLQVGFLTSFDYAQYMTLFLILSNLYCLETNTIFVFLEVSHEASIPSILLYIQGLKPASPYELVGGTDYSLKLTWLGSVGSLSGLE